MPRRNKAADGEEISVKRAKRINLSVRVAPKPEADEPAEEAEAKPNTLVVAARDDAEAADAGAAADGDAAAVMTAADRNKQLLLWTGVTFVMAVVLVIWIYNLNNAFRAEKRDSAAGEALDLEQISQQFSKTMQEVNQQLNQFSQLASSTAAAGETAPNLITSGAAEKPSSSTAETVSTGLSESQEIEMLKKKLEGLEKQIQEERANR